MLETVVDGLLDDAHPVCITLTSRSGLTRRRPNPSEANEAIPSPRVQQISFPGSNAQEAWRFSKCPAGLGPHQLTDSRLCSYASWSLFIVALLTMRS